MVSINTPYPLNEIEKDIQPEDFPENSIWREIVKECGPAVLILLAKHREQVSDRLNLRDYASVTRKAQQRHFAKQAIKSGK
jgi:hypothetical protein